MLFGVLRKAFRSENEAWQMIQVSVLGGRDLPGSMSYP